MWQFPQPHQNSLLTHPQDLDAPLHVAARNKINAYRDQYANNRITFMPAITSTSSRVHGEFLRLLFLQAHRETTAHFTAIGMLWGTGEPFGVHQAHAGPRQIPTPACHRRGDLSGLLGVRRGGFARGSQTGAGLRRAHAYASGADAPPVQGPVRRAQPSSPRPSRVRAQHPAQCAAVCPNVVAPKFGSSR